MADGKKKRSAKLVNLALNIETDNSSLNTSNRQVLNTTACGSSQRLGTKRARSLSAQFQSTSEFKTDAYNPSTSQAQTFYHSHKKRARSISTHAKPASNTESLYSSQEDMLLPSISTDQNLTRRRAKVLLSTHFECEAHTESCNALDHAGSIIQNILGSKRDVTSPHLEKLELTIPILRTKRCTSESTLKEFAQSAMQFTSTSGPLRSWITHNQIMNPKLMVMDIVENDNPKSNNSQGYLNVTGTLSAPLNSGIDIGENAGKSVTVKIGESDIMPCSFKLSTRDSDSSRQSSYPTHRNLFSEQVLSELEGNEEKPRRYVKVRGGKFASPCISKENIKKTADTETSSENEKPPITQKRPCKRVRTRGGKSCSASTSNTKTTSIEEQLTDIIGTTSEHENPSNRSENENIPISDEQLLQILEDPDENYDDDIFDDDFIENMNHSDNDSDTSIVSEGESVPRNTEEDQEWSNDHRQTRRINFEGNPVGLKIQPEGSEPIDYFNLVVTDEVLQIIVEKSNENASRILAQNFPGSRIQYWKDITLPEFKVFLGLLFHMGTIKLNRVQDYWKKNRLFNLTFFRQHMSRNRFLLILRVLHFENNNVDDTRLAKISLLVTYFNNRMKEIYFPSNNLCIDESLVLWRGRLIFRQYIKNKHNKYGIKLYLLTDVHGIILKTIVYAGAGDTIVGGTNHSSKVVMNLIQEYLNKGYSVYMDNFYNSVELTENLLSQNTYCTGTLRQNRKKNPKEVVNKKLKKGEYIAQYNKKGICVMKWRDNRDVLLISSEYDSHMTPTTTRRNTEIVKPNIVINYNKNMGGVDHQDQMLSYYSCEHKTVRWYKKLGIHILQQMLYNSFTIYNLLSGNKKSLYDFRLSVIESLVPDFNITNVRTFSQVHVIQPCPRKGKSMRRRCKVCWETEKKRKDTPYYCPDCDEQPGLCIVNCFKLYHNY